MKKASKILLFVGAAWLAACSDSTGVPTPNADGGNSVVRGGGVTADLSSTDTSKFTFAVNTRKATVIDLGQGNSLYFPAASVCDLSSSYGWDQWDQPCVPATGNVKIDGKAWLDRYGNPRVDFAQHVRFVPSNDPNHWVVLTFTDSSAALYKGTNILYCVDLTANCVNEATTDSTLATHTDPVTGKLWRRLKHFSGYNVFSGQPCDPSPSDPDCVDSGSGLMNRIVGPGLRIGQASSKPVLRSWTLAASNAGYMLAWA